jgi:tyrosine-protein phosphatase YwqE
VDDGVETMDEALRILATYETLGIKELWLTPHIMEDIPNTPQKLAARFEELKAAYKGGITLHLAAEYMIDNNLHKLIQEINSPSLAKMEYPKGEGVETNSLLPIGTAGKHILVETSYFNPPMRLKETLRQIKSLGYYPLLAHPERYMYMDNDEYRRLREEGVKFQLNLVSLAGGYGVAVKKKALWLLTNGLYSVAGSDLHSEDAIEFITKCKLSKKYNELLKQLLQNKI